MKNHGVLLPAVLIAALLLWTGIVFSADPPIAHWTLDETEGDIARDSAGDRDGVWVGAPGWVPGGGFYGGAIECFDDSAFIEIDDSDGSLFEELDVSFTVSVWIMVTEFTQDWQGILFKNNKFFLERNNSGGSGTVNGIHFKAKDEDGNQPFNLYGNITIDDGDWHHIVGVYDIDMAYLFVDGELDVEGEATGDMIGLIPDPFVIGAKFENNYRNSWNGLIDDVKLFNYAFDEVMVDSLFNVETGVKYGRLNQPKIMVLEQNYPNPFNAQTHIDFYLPGDTDVRLVVYNLRGEKMATLADGFYTAGPHHAAWNAAGCAGGLYFYRLETEFGSKTRKVVLQK